MLLSLHSAHFLLRGCRNQKINGPKCPWQHSQPEVSEAFNDDFVFLQSGAVVVISSFPRSVRSLLPTSWAISTLEGFFDPPNDRGKQQQKERIERDLLTGVGGD